MTVDERGINAINVALNASYKPGDYTYKELADIFEAIAKKSASKYLEVEFIVLIIKFILI